MPGQSLCPCQPHVPGTTRRSSRGLEERSVVACPGEQGFGTTVLWIAHAACVTGSREEPNRACGPRKEAQSV